MYVHTIPTGTKPVSLSGVGVLYNSSAPMSANGDPLMSQMIIFKMNKDEKK